MLGNTHRILVIDIEPMHCVFHTIPIPLKEHFLTGTAANSALWAEAIRKLTVRLRRRKEMFLTRLVVNGHPRVNAFIDASC